MLPVNGRNAVCCPVCRVALAPDRLASEFPPSEHTAVSSSLTVQDLLREASSNSGGGPSAPLDEQVKRFRKSFWEHDQEPAPGVLPGFRRMGGRWAPRLDMKLGLGALTAVMLVVSGILIHVLWRGSHGSLPPTLALAQVPKPAASLSAPLDPPDAPNSRLSMIALSTAPSRPSPAAVAVPGWRQWSGDTNGRAGGSRVAYYQQGKEVVELTFIPAPHLRPALRHPLEAVAGGARAVAIPNKALHVRPHEASRYGRDCLFFDYASKNTDWRIFTGNPYLPNAPYTVSWYMPPYVETVGADSPQVRDAFAQAYLAVSQQ